MSKSIVENGFVYYDPNTKILSISVMSNNQAKNTYGLNMNTKLNNKKIYEN